jgi:hypothetical protein
VRALALSALLLCACRTTGANAPSGVTVERLEITFDGEGRGQVDLGLELHGLSGGLVTQAQWQLLLDGHPVGSGVQIYSHRLEHERSAIALMAPLPLPHTNRDEGWRTVALEVAGEVTVTNLLTDRWPFRLRRQALIRGAPRPER